ncbi:uncharacterized protein Dyak_GE11163 [Drosophila yakuba]|uniref:Carboxylesterase type B domain-containing protein n=1 Tax=Drosophila yakuba TaxID=7245 RepID=B4IUR7_DROYA|nr:uncharacterized protein Dyak_GE11163 [Drosophila yakuba]
MLHCARMGENQLLLLLRLLLLPTVLFGCMDCSGASTADIYKGARLGHRIVQTRYGRLHGLILPLDSFRFLRSVEVFLGVPYATPPTKQNRFSPTRAPAPWDGIRISDKYSPVCPQRLPNIQNETAALEKMPKGRLEYLKRLLPFLENQSEDCLYLNVFSPVNAGANEKKLPVIVFIHGESFEWSSGNPYDGSVLASYGEVVVVTLNYRLGILGFLNANPNPHAHARVANYGLMDQMAALHWIQQNIQKFGGDPNSVTLAGHGTGAACINYLMTSPTMVRGLFHRAILMSGSAYSSWALVEDPVLFAIKLAKEVNCTIPDDINRHHEQIVDCLRDVPLEDLYIADIQAPNFLTSFGPSVDGVVIRPGHSNLDIDDLMARNSRRSSADSGFQSSAGGGGGQGGGAGGGGGGGSGSAFGGGYFGGGGAGAMNMGGHYDVLFGVVTGESIWRFSAHDIQNGFEGERRDKIIRTYVRNAYNYHLNEIFYTVTGANEKKLPVIVFIHGESFEWSSGNPYDGSVLASYGEVVVVTLNYRLGILGFLNANPNPHAHARVANYGLMDQMAALHWIQQNIQKFGGDPNSVTLAGHGTGAACINYLMTSPTMVRGLFHRAILMSGSAYSSWALVEDPVLFAIKLAKEVNCTIPDDINRHHEQIVDCLRDVPLEDLYIADIQAPNFLTSFGPSVDGVVIRPGHSNLDIDDLMARNSRRSSADSGFQSSAGGGGGQGGGAGGGGGGGSGSAFGGGYFSGGGAGAMNMGGHYDVLFGVVTGESIWRFSAHDIQNGFEGERRDKIIRTYVRNAYNYHLNEIFYTIVNEYTDWDRTSQHPINTRDTAVAALSDAQFVAPIVRAGDILAANSPPPVSSSSPAGAAGANAAASTSAGSTQPSGRCYFYVFDYQTKDGDYPQRMGTVHGEDLPYIFGAPLVDGFSHFPQNYTKSETALSEAVMIFWTNFARTGNPNEHHRQDSSLPVSKERNRFRSITWENYDPLHQKYLEIGMKPRIKNHFRAHQLSIWLRLIPELHRAGMEDVIARHNLFRNHDDMDLYEGPVKPDPFGISTAAGATGSSSSSSSSSRLLLVDEQLMMKKGRGLNASAYLNGILGGK